MSGYWVDWNGCVRDVANPGKGYRCKIVQHDGFLGVDVYCSAGYVVHEADYHSSIESLKLLADEYGFQLKFYEMEKKMDSVLE